MAVSLVRKSFDCPEARKGRPYSFDFNVETSDGSAMFPSGTYSGLVKASSAGSALETATVTRVSDSSVTVDLTDTQIDTVCAGLTGDVDGLYTFAPFLIEIIRTDTTPDEFVTMIETGVIL